MSFLGHTNTTAHVVLCTTTNSTSSKREPAGKGIHRILWPPIPGFCRALCRAPLPIFVGLLVQMSSHKEGWIERRFDGDCKAFHTAMWLDGRGKQNIDHFCKSTRKEMGRDWKEPKSFTGFMSQKVPWICVPLTTKKVEVPGRKKKRKCWSILSRHWERNG